MRMQRFQSQTLGSMYPKVQKFNVWSVSFFESFDFPVFQLGQTKFSRQLIVNSETSSLTSIQFVRVVIYKYILYIAQ